MQRYFDIALLQNKNSLEGPNVLYHLYCSVTLRFTATYFKLTYQGIIL